MTLNQHHLKHLLLFHLSNLSSINVSLCPIAAEHRSCSCILGDMVFLGLDGYHINTRPTNNKKYYYYENTTELFYIYSLSLHILFLRNKLLFHLLTMYQPILWKKQHFSKILKCLICKRNYKPDYDLTRFTRSQRRINQPTVNSLIESLHDFNCIIATS